MVPIVPAMLRPIAPPDNESKLALSAQAHALVPEIHKEIDSIGCYCFVVIFFTTPTNFSPWKNLNIKYGGKTIKKS